MMYTDKKLEDDSDSDWDDMTTQPVVERSTLTEDTNANGTKLSHKEENHGIPKDKEDQTKKVEAVTAHAPKVDSQIQTKQFGVSLGVSRTLPKLGHSVPTPPLSNRPRQGRRRQERSVDPPYEFSSLTDESDKYSLSKAVSAPLKSNKYFQTEKVADRTSNPVQKRNSWDEVSELQEDNLPTLIEKTTDIAPVQQDSCTDPIKPTFVESATDFPPKHFPITQQEALENIHTPQHETDTFTIQETNNPQLSSKTEQINCYVQQTSEGAPEKVTRSLTHLSHQSPSRGTRNTHMHSTNTIDGIYMFEEMSSDRVEYERDLRDAYMMNLAMRSERKIQRFWQEVFGCLRLFVSFFTFFLIECLRFFLRHIFQKLCIGILIICADHMWKPLLQCCYNGCLMPSCVLCANISSSLVQVLLPVLGCISRLLREIARCCRSIRLCEITYPASMHQDYTRLNTHIL